MLRTRAHAAALAAASLATLAPAAAKAGAFYLQEQSVRGTGRAYSGEVADQGVESLWWNPAAIARSPREVYVGVHGVIVESKVSDLGSTISYPGGITVPVGGEPRGFNPIQAGAAPNFAIAIPFADRFAVGVSLAAPFNFETDYRPNAWTRYDALLSRLNTADLQLTGAMRVTDWLDLGVGFDAQRTEAKLSQASPNLSPLLPDGIQQLSGSGWNYGWTAGAQARFGDFTFGASYRSAMDHGVDGRIFVGGLLGPLAAANLDAPASAKFTTPWIATAGLRWRATDKLTLNGQVQHFGWSEFDAIRVSTPLGPQVIVQDYRDTTSGGVGLDYAVTPKVTVRAGVQYDPTPTRPSLRTARVPDGDRWLFGVGATAQATKRLKVEGAFAFIDFQDSTVNHDTTFYEGTPAATTTRLRGNVTGAGYVLSVGARATF